jgi:ribosome-associated protein
VLIDSFDVIVHLFLDDAREFYGLERLWDEAESVSLVPAAAVR